MITNNITCKNIIARPIPTPLGHGSSIITKTLIGSGNKPIDYYGVVSAADFIDGDTLSAALGVTGGTRIAEANNSDWLKVGYNDKILFFPKLVYRHEIPWNHLYNLGIVFGTDTVGYSGGTVMQDKTIKIGRHVYRVRLFSTKGSPSLTGNIDSASSSSIINPMVSGSEWNEIMYRMSATAGLSVVNRFESFTNVELCLGTGGSTAGTYTWMSDVVGSYRCVRGWNGATFFSSKYFPTSTAIWMGWRPVLELVR